MEEKKKTNKLLYTIMMFIVFFVIAELGIWGLGGYFFYDNIAHYPQGNLVIQEVITSILVLIVMLLFKNSYVFTQKHEKLSVGLHYGLFYLLIACFLILVFGIGLGSFKYYHSVINVLLSCAFIGICEEFLCRGWLLNEFLERFDSTKKGVWYSIIASGIIFGLMHMGNILAGQSVPGTIMQVLNATITGVVFGFIYYKTKNIWLVVILHGIWDFSLFLPDLVPSFSASPYTTDISVRSLVFTIMYCLSELIIIVPYFKNINAKLSKLKNFGIAMLASVLYCTFSLLSIMISSNTSEEYKYGKINLDNYSKTIYYYDNYQMQNNDVLIKFGIIDKKLMLTNVNTNYSVELDYHNFNDYIIIDDGDKYILGYINYIDDGNVFLEYEYIAKDSLNNSNECLNNIKNNMKKYLVPDDMTLLSINGNGKTYLALHNVDYGYYLLTSDDMLSLMNVK